MEKIGLLNSLHTEIIMALALLVQHIVNEVWKVLIQKLGSIHRSEIGNNMPEISSFCADRYNGIMDTGPKFKFSNIFSSLVTAYTLGSMEGWPEIMND